MSNEENTEIIEKNLSIWSELKKVNFGFNYDQPQHFFISKWQSSNISWMYLIYRWIWASCFIVCFLISINRQFYAGKFFIFLTNWGFIACVLTEILSAILVTRWYYNCNKLRDQYQNNSTQHQKMTKILKIYWVMFTISLQLAMATTIIYWGFIYNPKVYIHPYPVINCMKHGFNTFLMFTDLMIVAFPLRLLHTIYTMTLALIYIIFSFIYHLASGTDELGNKFIYPILNWNEPFKVLATTVGVYLFLILLAIGLLLLDKFKILIHSTITQKTQ